MNRLFFVVMGLLPIYVFGQQNIRFIEENIDFSINTSRFSVNGIFTFVNTLQTAAQPHIYFPIPKQTDSVHIHQVYHITYNKPIQYQHTADGIAFKINMLANDTVHVHIVYSQKTQRKNTYILSSTQTWGEPLEHARYSLETDSTISLVHLNIKPDTVMNKVYFWDRRNFYPDNDFIVEIAPYKNVQ